MVLHSVMPLSAASFALHNAYQKVPFCRIRQKAYKGTLFSPHIQINISFPHPKMCIVALSIPRFVILIPIVKTSVSFVYLPYIYRVSSVEYSGNKW